MEGRSENIINKISKIYRCWFNWMEQFWVSSPRFGRLKMFRHNLNEDLPTHDLLICYFPLVQITQDSVIVYLSVYQGPKRQKSKLLKNKQWQMARFYLNEGQTYLLDIDDLPNALIYRKNKLYSLGKHWLKFFWWKIKS